MSIQNKLRITNILSALLPVLSVLLILIASFEITGVRYWLSLEAMYKDERGVYSAQSLLYAYKNELNDFNWENYEREEDEDNEQEGEYEDETSINPTKNMMQLEDELLSMGYYLIVRTQEEPLYSNLPENKEKTLYITDAAVLKSAGNYIVSHSNYSIIKNSYRKNDNDIEIIAVSFINNYSGDSYIQRYIVTTVMIALISLILLIILINIIISLLTRNMISKPLKVLADGADNIKEGNLNFKMNYKKKDEFGEVCKAFDDMREHLENSTKARTLYEEQRREMLRGISHDLRTPLTAIKGYSEGLLDGIADTNEKRDKYALVIKQKAKDMENLADNLSLLTLFENQSPSYHTETINIEKFIKAIAEEYTDRLEFDFDNKAEHILTNIDKYYMKRVFTNIFENSHKYIKKENKKIYIKFTNSEQNIIISICDNGDGVSNEALIHMFEPFYREDSVRSNVIAGNGLGLSIVKEIIEKHNGQISAYNNDGLCIQIVLLYAERK